MHYRKRQQRPRGYHDPGHAPELTFSCFRRYPFLTETTCAWLSTEIQNACEELQYVIWAYVFMPDHVHLIVHPKARDYNESDFLKRIKEPVSRQAVAFLKRESPTWLARIRVPHGEKIEHHFWQPGRGHDRNIDNSRTLLSMIEYVHQNPVRKGLVEHARDWKWSSAGWFEGRPLNGLQPEKIPQDWLEDAS